MKQLMAAFKKGPAPPCFTRRVPRGTISSLLLSSSQGGAQEAPTDDQSRAGNKHLGTEAVTITPAGADPATIVRHAKPLFLSLTAAEEEVSWEVSFVFVLDDPLALEHAIAPDSWRKKKRSASLMDRPPGESYLPSSGNQILRTITLS